MESLCFIESVGSRELRKKLIKDGKKIITEPRPLPLKFTPEIMDFTGLENLADFLNQIRGEPSISMIMGFPKKKFFNDGKPFNRVKDHKSTYKDGKLSYLILDVDHLKLNLNTPEKVIAKRLPKSLHRASCVACLTSSWGINGERSYRFFYRLSEPLSLLEQKKIAEYIDCDKKIYQSNRVIYTADPIGPGAPKIKDRIFHIKKEHDVVDVSTLWADIGKPKSLDIERNKAIERIKAADEGDRNNTLFLEAVQLASAWMDENRDPLQLFEPLKRAAMDAGLGEEETIATLNSALTRASENGSRKKIKDRFYELACESIEAKVYSEEGDAFIRTANRVVRLGMKERDGKNWLTNLFKNTYQKIPELSDVQAVMNALIADVSREDPKPVYIRCAPEPDKIIVSRDEQNFIEIGFERFRGKEGFPDSCFFVGASKSGVLPKPELGDKSLFELIEGLFPSLTDEQIIMVCSWLIGVFDPGIKYPILCLTGIRGSGKSTLAAALKYFTDPAKGSIDNQLTAEPKGPDDLFVLASNQHVTVLDNISYVDNSMSDALAVIATGGSARSRTLYSDNDLFERRLKKPLVITSINQVTKNSDLADRSIAVNLKALKNSESEKSLFQKIEEARPYILGCICEALSCSMAYQNEVVVRNIHRMYGWVRTVCAACESGYVGFNSEDFLNAVYQDRKNVSSELIENDSVARELIKLISRKGTWKGQLSDLDNLLSIGLMPRPKDWPGTPHAFSRRIKLIEPDLKKWYQIYISQRRTSIGRYWIITKSKKELNSRDGKSILTDPVTRGKYLKK